MTSVRAMQHEGRKLSNKMIRSAPDLYVRVMRYCDVSAVSGISTAMREEVTNKLTFHLEKS